MNPDFDTTTKGELRAYVIARPEDRAVFHVFVVGVAAQNDNRFTAEASSTTFDISNE